MFNIKERAADRLGRLKERMGRRSRARKPKSGQPKDWTRSFIMLGLAMGMLLASLDQTVVGTSLPRIVAVLGGMDLFTWLFTSYMLAQTITIPIAGKMSDRLGRKPIFLAGMGLFMAGSLVAGFSTSMEMLIACRFVQGLGGGALMPVAMATVADLYAPQDRGKIQGLLGAVFALSTVVGPFIGGFIVDNWDWDWVFWVNLPIGVFAVAVASFKFPRRTTVPSTPIDYPGMLTLTGTLVPALLVMTWGGSTYAWDSAEIVGLAALSAAMLLAFVLVERRAADPLIPFGLFKEPIFTLGSIGLLIMALGMFGTMTFMPLFLQAVMGFSATNSGVLTIPVMAGAMVTSVASGFALKRTGYKVWLLVGPPLAAVGLFLFSTLHEGSPALYAILYMVLLGAGLGAVMSNYIVAAQNVMPKKDMGVVTSSMSLFRSIGGTVGVATLGAVMNGQMAAEIGKNLPAEAAAYVPVMDATSLGNFLLDPVASAAIPPFILDAIRLSLSNSITFVFLISAVIVLSAVVFSALVRSVPLKSAEEYHERSVPAPSHDDAEEQSAGVPGGSGSPGAVRK